MMNTINNQKDDDIKQSRIWVGQAMKGTWDGNGMWLVDCKKNPLYLSILRRAEEKSWKGHGTWQGGLLDGTWDGMGSWEPVGEWKGNGNLISNMSFPKSLKMILFATGLVAVVVIALIAVADKGLISSELAIGGGIVAVVLLVMGSIVIGERNTVEGKWWAEGIWKDEEEFRILDMTGNWKLGNHIGIIKGKMKDPKPKDLMSMENLKTN